jgi:stress responsive alpha/beta barrel protein
MRCLISFTIIALLICSSCINSSKAYKTDSIQSEFQQFDNAPLVHIVLLKVKENVDSKKLIEEIEKLNGIPGLINLEVGTFKDLGDTRALSAYSIIIQMRFENEKDYQTYQQHPIHLRLKENTKSYLASPPSTYDYWKVKIKNTAIK